VVPERSIAIYVLLSIFTFGLWGLVWFFQMAGDIGRLRSDGKPSALIDLVLIICTCGIWAIVIGYMWGDKLNGGMRERGLPVNENLPVITLVLSIFGLQLIALVLWQIELNKAAVA